MKLKRLVNQPGAAEAHLKVSYPLHVVLLQLTGEPAWCFRSSSQGELSCCSSAAHWWTSLVLQKLISRWAILLFLCCSLVNQPGATEAHLKVSYPVVPLLLTDPSSEVWNSWFRVNWRRRLGLEEVVVLISVFLNTDQDGYCMRHFVRFSRTHS